MSGPPTHVALVGARRLIDDPRARELAAALTARGAAVSLFGFADVTRPTVTVTSWARIVSAPARGAHDPATIASDRAAREAAAADRIATIKGSLERLPGPIARLRAPRARARIDAIRAELDAARAAERAALEGGGHSDADVWAAFGEELQKVDHVHALDGVSTTAAVRHLGAAGTPTITTEHEPESGGAIEAISASVPAADVAVRLVPTAPTEAATDAGSDVEGRTGYSRHASGRTDRLLIEEHAVARVLTATGVVDRQPAAAAIPDYFRLARRAADTMVDRLIAVAPATVHAAVPGIDLERALRLDLTLRYAIKELPGIVAAMRSASDELVVANAGLPVEALAEVAERVGGPARIAVTSTASNAVVDAHRSWLEQAREAPGLQEVTGGVRPGGAAVLVGAGTELAYLRAVTDALGSAGPVLHVAKHDGGDALSTIERLEPTQPVVRAETLAGLGIDDDAWTLASAAIDTLPTGSPDPALMDVIADALALQRLALTLHALIEGADLRVLAGSMDRTTWGALAAAAPVRSINVQHGALLPFAIADLLAFDVALTWGPASTRALRADGYAPQHPVVEVGNAAWDAGPVQPCPEDLDAWRGDDRVAVVLTQAVKGPLLTAALIEDTYRCIDAAIAASPGWKVLVKLRHGQDGVLERETFRSDRVRIVSAEDVPLRGALACADVALSIYSTALLDAAAAGVAPVAIDLARAEPLARLDLWDSVTVVHTEAELRELFASPPAGPDAAIGDAATAIRDAIARIVS